MQPTQWPSTRKATVSLATRKPSAAASADSFLERRPTRSSRGSLSSASVSAWRDAACAPTAARASASKGNTDTRSTRK